MKVQITVTSPLGIFIGDPSEVTENELISVKQLLESAGRLSVLTITREGRTFYFPPEVIQKSVISLDVQSQSPQRSEQKGVPIETTAPPGA